nr:DegV family protein [Caldifermentibacillus hisashii]
MKKIKITCDRTADLPDEYLIQNDIETIPLYIILDDKTYRDGIDITPDDIFSYAERTGKLPKTAAAQYKIILIYSQNMNPMMPLFILAWAGTFPALIKMHTWLLKSFITCM